MPRIANDTIELEQRSPAGRATRREPLDHRLEVQHLEDAVELTMALMTSNPRWRGRSAARKGGQQEGQRDDAPGLRDGERQPATQP